MFPQLGTGRDAPPVEATKAKALAFAAGAADKEIKNVHASVASTFRGTADHEGALPGPWFITDAQADHAHGVLARRFAARRQRYDDCECAGHDLLLHTVARSSTVAVQDSLARGCLYVWAAAVSLEASFAGYLHAKHEKEIEIEKNRWLRISEFSQVSGVAFSIPATPACTDRRTHFPRSLHPNLAAGLVPARMGEYSAGRRRLRRV